MANTQTKSGLLEGGSNIYGKQRATGQVLIKEKSEVKAKAKAKSRKGEEVLYMLKKKTGGDLEKKQKATFKDEAYAEAEATVVDEDYLEDSLIWKKQLIWRQS